VGIQLDQINLVVGDMAAMAEFYGRLGLVIRPAAGEWAPHHRSARGAGADLDLDSPEFASVWDAGWPGGAGIVLGFRVEERPASTSCTPSSWPPATPASSSPSTPPGAPGTRW
jgi:hypothetical protein